jgi:hypothetical protein
VLGRVTRVRRDCGGGVELIVQLRRGSMDEEAVSVGEASPKKFPVDMHVTPTAALIAHYHLPLSTSQCYFGCVLEGI